MARQQDDDLKKKKDYFKRKFPNFKKKAMELSILCDNSVGFICYCYGPDKDDIHVWPEPEKNQQAIPQIVSKFNIQSDQKRKNHASDLTEYLLTTTQSGKKKNNTASEYSSADLEGLSIEELKRHLSLVNAHLVGVRQKKTSLLLRNSNSSDQLKPDGTKDHHQLRVSDSTTDTELCLPKNRSTTSLSGFDELSCVVRGSGPLRVSNQNFGVSSMEAVSSPLDLVPLGFYGGDNLPTADRPMAVTSTPGFCGNDHVFSSPLPPLITCDGQLQGNNDPSMSMTENWEFVSYGDELWF